ncbi:MAG: serine/threonine-protein kinase [Terrimicrobiaceae bacterium]
MRACHAERCQQPYLEMTIKDSELPYRPPSEAGNVKNLIKGRYSLDRELGRGGAGEVFLAYDQQLERWVAIKRMRVDMGGVAEREKFAIREAKRLARLQHPNIVTVYDLLEHEGDLLLVMEYLAGRTLEDLEDPLVFRDFVEVARQSLVALVAAHDIGMIHLDIKPTNIMLERMASGHLNTKLLDFGLATLLEQSLPEENEDEESVLGSVYNMAPEQLQREPLGFYTDLYSLGCAFYFALSRKEPFEAESVEAVIDAHLRHDFVPLAKRRPDIPKDVCRWVERLMARTPSERPAGAQQALAELHSKLASRRAVDRQGSASDGGHHAPPILDAANASALKAQTGKRATVEGRVQRVWENFAGSAKFINFVGVSHQEFCLVLESGRSTSNLPEFQSLVGTTIRATGKITDFHGSPQMLVESADQIKKV